jgi:hypothetical protein
MIHRNDEQHRLQRLLDEDTSSPEEAQALLPLLARLRCGLPADKGKRTRLLQSLVAEMVAQPQSSPKTRDTWWPLLLLWSQVRVLQREALLASTLILVLGALVTSLLDTRADALGSLPIVLLAPLAAAAGTALIYNDRVAQSLEVEQTTPVPVQVILLARLLIIFSLDCALALAGSAMLAVASPQLSFWPLVLSWLAPMTFLSMLAFLLSVLSRDSLFGIVVSMTLWAILSVGRMASAALPWLVRLPDLTAAAARPWLFTLALACVLAALWFAGRPERTLGGVS